MNSGECSELGPEQWELPHQSHPLSRRAPCDHLRVWEADDEAKGWLGLQTCISHEEAMVGLSPYWPLSSPEH